MEHVAIQGTFADLKSVKTRSVVQMVIEIPIEQAERVVSMFGFPQPGAEIAVAVARLDPEKAKGSVGARETPAKPKKRFHELPLSQQAALRCQDGGFREFLTAEHAMIRNSDAADFVRRWCEVKSRAELDSNAKAASLWTSLNYGYEQATGLAPQAR